ncbi:MAG: hypothetical protein Q9M36_14600 [Sulfurovum sp.]|nr:hypothetical protein [Sulfurovum sp.]
MKYILGAWIYFISTLYASEMICTYCHQNQMHISGLKTKEQWKSLSSDGGLGLQEIHQYNVAVLAYFQSPEYNATELYDYVEFHASNQEALALESIIESCTYCHDSKMTLSRLWSKNQWQNLAHSVENLKVLHQNELQVLSFIDSKPFEKSLANFIHSMQFFAAEKEHPPTKLGLYTGKQYPDFIWRKFAFKNKSFGFVYEKMQGQEAEAQKIYKAMQTILQRCNMTAPIDFRLKHGGWSLRKSDVFLWVLTFASLEVRSTLSFTLEATQEGKTYTSKKFITEKNRWFKMHTSSEIIGNILDTVMDDMTAQLGLECERGFDRRLYF